MEEHKEHGQGGHGDGHCCQGKGRGDGHGAGRGHCGPHGHHESGAEHAHVKAEGHVCCQDRPKA